MSVFDYNLTQYKVSCDGPGRCPNHHVFGKSPEAVAEASDWLLRHGWRTIEMEHHYCAYCVNRMEIFQGESTDELEQRYSAGRSQQYGRI